MAISMPINVRFVKNEQGFEAALRQVPGSRQRIYTVEFGRWAYAIYAVFDDRGVPRLETTDLEMVGGR
jgi:hypothetical protein